MSECMQAHAVDPGALEDAAQDTRQANKGTVTEICGENIIQSGALQLEFDFLCRRLTNDPCLLASLGIGKLD